MGLRSQLCAAQSSSFSPGTGKQFINGLDFVHRGMVMSTSERSFPKQCYNRGSTIL